MILPENDHVCLKAILKEKQFWILFLLGVLYCYRPLFLGETYFYRDLYEHSIPQKRLFVDLIRSGEIPLWDPYLHGGQPFLAEINNLPLYPSGLLYLVLPFLTAFNLDIALHIIFCGWTAYSFCRSIRLTKSSALIAGIIYELCGFTLSQVNLLNRLTALPYLPLVLMFWHRYLTESRKRYFACAVVFAMVQVFAASPETSLLTYLTVLLWSLFYSYPHTIFRKIRSWLLLVVFVAGASAIQIIPTLEMIQQSSRPHLSFELFTSWSLQPKRLPEIIFPRFMGRTDALSESDYWGKAIEGVPYAYVMSIYFGLVVLALCIAGGLSKDPDERLPVRVRRYLFLQFLISGLLAFGRFLPGFHLLYEYVPVIHWFRYPIKFLAAGILPVSLLAAFAVEIYFVKHVWRRNHLILLWSLALLVASFSIVFAFHQPFAASVQTFFFRQAQEYIHQGLKFSFFHAASIWIAFVLLCQARKMKPRAWQVSTLAMILVFDLYLSGKPVNPSAPRVYFVSTPPLVESVRKEISGGRLFRDEVPSRVVLRAPSNDVIWQNLWYMQVLNYYVGAYYKIPVIFHVDYDNLAQRRVMQMKSIMDRLPWERKIPVLSAAAVTVVLTEQQVPQMELTGIVRNPSRLIFYLYRNHAAAPRVSFVTNAVSVNTPKEALVEMTKVGYEARNSVVLEKGPGIRAGSNCSPVRMNVLEQRANHSVYSVENDCEGYLVFSEPYYPGWRVWIDEKKTDVLRANYAFSAIVLPAGKHTIRRSFVPLSVIAGALCTLGFLVTLALMPQRFFQSSRPTGVG